MNGTLSGGAVPVAGCYPIPGDDAYCQQDPCKMVTVPPGTFVGGLNTLEVLLINRLALIAVFVIINFTISLGGGVSGYTGISFEICVGPPATATSTPTVTLTSTRTPTPTMTPSSTIAVSSTPTPLQTMTATPGDEFLVSRNVYRPGYDDPSVFVRIRLSQAGIYSLKVYNSAGELVKVLRDEKIENGAYENVYWDGTNKFNEPVASGVYIINYSTRYQTRLAKLIILR